MLCGGSGPINRLVLQEQLLSRGFRVRSTTGLGMQDCVEDFPRGESDKILFILKIERTDSVAVLNARMWRANPHPREWDEVYTIRPNLVEGIELRPAAAID